MSNKNKHSKDAKGNSSEGLNPLPWAAGALFIMGLAILAGIYWNDAMKIRDISFEGNHFTADSPLRRRANIPVDVPADSIDFMKVIKRIEALNYVRKADVSVEPSGKVLIRITERDPMALLVNGSDKTYIDKDGISLPLIPGKAVDVPLFYGLHITPAGDTLKSKKFETARNFLIAMKNNPVSNATISEIAWTRDEGIVALTHENGVKLIFGRNDFNNRLRNWKAFYAQVVKTRGLNSLRTIDLRFQGQIVSR